MERSKPIAWLTEIQTQRSTSCVFHQRSSRFCTLIVFQLSILKKQTHHHCIVKRLKRPPKNLQTHPPLPRAFLFRHFSLGYWEFKTKIGGNIASAISIFPMILKPLKTTSVIHTRTLSNLFAKKNSDSILQA